MQQLMNEFYSKKDKKPRVPKLSNNLGGARKRGKDPTMPTFTVEEMMKTVNTDEGVHINYDFGGPKEPMYVGGDISGTGGQKSKKPKTAKKKKRDFGAQKRKAKFGKTFGSTTKGVSRKRPSTNAQTSRKSREEPTLPQLNRTRSIDKKKDTMRNAEFMMMKSDLNDYKRKISNNQDINRFEEFLRGDMEGEPETPFGDDRYLTNEPPEPEVDMKDAIKYMTREERQEYLNQKKLLKKKRFEDEMKKQNSFQPKINKKSKAIDQNRTKNMKFKRHDLLFGLNTVLKQREEHLKEVIEAERFMKYAQDELNECTFHPRINRGGPVTMSEGTIADRSRAFMEKKRRKQMEHDRVREMNEVKDCTFTPQINKPRAKVDDYDEDY